MELTLAAAASALGRSSVSRYPLQIFDLLKSLPQTESTQVRKRFGFCYFSELHQENFLTFFSLLSDIGALRSTPKRKVADGGPTSRGPPHSNSARRSFTQSVGLNRRSMPRSVAYLSTLILGTCSSPTIKRPRRKLQSQVSTRVLKISRITDTAFKSYGFQRVQ